jgi:hypothetical protein
VTARLGLLAYGSLIDDPGAEISASTVEILRLGVTTPFPVEFARSSRTRAGAPTLVPVATGGARIPARVLVLRQDISEPEARDMLWRRETGRKGQAPVILSDPGPNDVIIDRLVDFHGIPLVLYTKIAPNITPLTPRRLAELAVRSARSGEAERRARDGISYLIVALRNGARTKLSGAYEREVLRLTGAARLAEALGKVRRTSLSPSPGTSMARHSGARR